MAKSVNDITSTTQQYLDIYDISNDFLILKDGSTSLILTVSAMNFGLLAEEEQDSIMYAYAGLLNSLNYPIQIVIRSQTKDVTSYLQLLKDEEDKAISDTRRNWIARYRQFVGELIKERNVLDKKFYVAIPATNLEMGLLSASTVVPGVKQIDISKIERSVILEKAREILEPKRDYLIAQFGRIGLQSRQLTTQEIIQFFYLSYNPEAAEGQQITDTNSYTTAMVQASMQGGFMDNVTTQPMATPVSGANQMTQPMTDQTRAPQVSAPQTELPQQNTPQQNMSQSVMSQPPMSQPQINPSDVIGDGVPMTTATGVTPPSPALPTNPQLVPPVNPVVPNTPTLQTPSMPSSPAMTDQNQQVTQQVPPAQPVEQNLPDQNMAQQTQPVNPETNQVGMETQTRVDDIQNEINSTLQELGQSDSVLVPPVQPAPPAMMPSNTQMPVEPQVLPEI